MGGKYVGIQFNEESKVFHLQSKDTSYVMQIIRDGYLSHLYWGKKIKNYHHSNDIQYLDRAFSGNPDPTDRTFSLDTLPQEYPAYGNTDFRTPAYQLQFQNGSTVSDVRYKSHKIFKGKPALQGLPATYVEDEQEAETLEVTLEDTVAKIEILLSYSVYEEKNVITRSAKIVNNSSDFVDILRALSVNVDIRDAEFELLHLSGAWGNERLIERNPLRRGVQSVSSARGASSHQHNPFLALVRENTTEDNGEIFSFNLVYSGNFLANVEVDQFKNTRVSLGINPFDFKWLLQPGDSFQCPEVVMVYSNQGLGDMSRTYHDLYRTRLCRGEFKDKERPILVNNWEATYFDFTAAKIEEIAKVGQELGIELFVLDDGWFGKRDDDTSSLGDWFVDRNKLPDGLDSLAKNVEKLDMQFGLWFEPEMISVNSELYRDHPDWCLHVPNRRRSESRNQLILDFSRDEVCDAIIKMVSDILSSVPVSYVKWDMNRHMTEIGSAVLPPERQRETAHRYMLGLYKVMEKITTNFPHILFESCSGGGGRFDPGILYYMPQTWTSDNTDAISRLKIQYGTSLVYPISSMGAHVSDVPNHQVHRTTSLDIRGDVAMAGNFGYELDLTKMSEEDKEIVKKQVATYKEIRRLVQYGDFYRLVSPFEGNETAWLFVNDDKTESVVFYYRILAEANGPLSMLKLKGLNHDKSYQLIETGKVYGGDELEYVGLSIPANLNGDFKSCMWRLKEI